MVLERIVTIREAIRSPLSMFFASALIALVCLSVSLLIFRKTIGLFTTFWITFTMVPFMANLFQYEEAKEEEILLKRKEIGIFRRYKEIIFVYAAFFSGIVFVFSILFTILPAEIAEEIFKEQIEEIKLIRGFFAAKNELQLIIINNLSVLFVCFALSLLFGVGAIFVLTWNATILASAIGMLAKSFGGLKALPYSMLVFFPHGSIEILAYFIGAISGGVISVAVSRRKSKALGLIVLDSLKFLAIAVLLILIAACVEVLPLIIL